MMNDTMESAGTIVVKNATQILDSYLGDKGVSEETRDALINSFEMMYEYIPYAIKQGKSPTDGAALREFLTGKGIKTAKFLGNDSVNCGLAIVEFLLSSYKAYTSTSTGLPPLITMTYGIAFLDLIEVGNKCEPAQTAYYEAFLKESSVKLQPIKTRVEAGYCAPPPSQILQQPLH